MDIRHSSVISSWMAKEGIYPRYSKPVHQIPIHYMHGERVRQLAARRLLKAGLLEQSLSMSP